MERMNEDELPPALRSPDPALHIRPVRLSDAAALRAALWPERDFEEVYLFIRRAGAAASQGRGLGALVEGPDETALGYGQVTLWPRCAEISDLMVAEARRDQGLGTALIQYLTRAAREMQAECIEIGGALTNPRAIALYRRMGFRDSRTVRVMTRTGPEDVLYLRIKLR